MKENKLNISTIIHSPKILTTGGAVNGKLTEKPLQDKKREDFPLKYMGLVTNIALRIKRRLPEYARIGLDDLRQYGFLGLSKALGSYDEAKKVPFNLYAKFLIDKAIVDGLRAEDHLTHHTRKITKEIAEILQENTNRINRGLIPRTEEEIAEKLNINNMSRLRNYITITEHEKNPVLLNNGPYLDKSSKYRFIDIPDNGHKEPNELIDQRIKKKIILSTAQKFFSKITKEDKRLKLKYVFESYFLNNESIEDIANKLSLKVSHIYPLIQQIKQGIKSILKSKKLQKEFD